MIDLGQCDWGSCQEPARYVVQLRTFASPHVVSDQRPFCEHCMTLDASCMAGSDWAFSVVRKSFERTPATSYQPWVENVSFKNAV